MNIPQRKPSRLPNMSPSLFSYQQQQQQQGQQQGQQPQPIRSNSTLIQPPLISSSSIMTITTPTTAAAARPTSLGKQLGREALRDLNYVFDALHTSEDAHNTPDRVDARVAEKAFERIMPSSKEQHKHKQYQQQPIIQTQYSTKEFRERFYSHQACKNIPVGPDEVFDILDQDRNGFLEQMELKQVLESFGIQLTDEEARVMVALTGDEEEGLTMKSFRKIWRSIHADQL